MLFDKTAHSYGNISTQIQELHWVSHSALRPAPFSHYSQWYKWPIRRLIRITLTNEKGGKYQFECFGLVKIIAPCRPQPLSTVTHVLNVLWVARIAWIAASIICKYVIIILKILLDAGLLVFHSRSDCMYVQGVPKKSVICGKLSLRATGLS